LQEVARVNVAFELVAEHHTLICRQVYIAWRRLLRSETDREPLPRLSRERWSRWYRAWPGQRQDNGRYVRRGALLIGPGGRWRLECWVPGRGAEGEAAKGDDGERGWSWRPPEVGGPRRSRSR
jgi:hypothetical protein